MKIIVDASVALKWFFAENYNKESDRLLEGEYTLLAPDFILTEAANILWKKNRKGELKSTDDRETFQILRNAFKALIPTSSIIEKAFDVAKELDHSVYDCIYLQTAVEEDAVLITADRAFYDCVKRSSYSDLIIWIADPIEVT